MTESDVAFPDLSFVIPAANENRWSDLLATLISTDPRPIAGLIGVECDAVRREVVVPGLVGRRSDRLDLLLLREGREVAAVEVKLLSDLGPQQLARYHAAFPSVEVYRVLHLEGLPVNLRGTAPWESLTWESVLVASARSENSWVATTARAWLAQLASLVPVVDADTVWNDVPDDPTGFELALRARIAWLSRQMDSWCDLEHDIVPSSGGGNWAARMWADSPAPGHFVTAEVQEGLTAYEWRVDPDSPYRDRLPGPVVLLGLRQDGVTTSADFDWALLHRMFAEHVIDETGHPRDDRAWHTTAARPADPVDRQNWQAIVQGGGTPVAGQGPGHEGRPEHSVVPLRGALRDLAEQHPRRDRRRTAATSAAHRGHGRQMICRDALTISAASLDSCKDDAPRSVAQERPDRRGCIRATATGSTTPATERAGRGAPRWGCAPPVRRSVADQPAVSSRLIRRSARPGSG